MSSERHYFQWIEEADGSRKGKTAPIYVEWVDINVHDDYVEILIYFQWFAMLNLDGSASDISKGSFRFILATSRFAELEKEQQGLEVFRELIRKDQPHLDVR